MRDEAPARPRNIAARMALWSAHHRKKAIFGWLGLSIALFAISIVSPMKSIVFETSGPGESGRANTIIYEDFKQPAGEGFSFRASRSPQTTPSSGRSCGT